MRGANSPQIHLLTFYQPVIYSVAVKDSVKHPPHTGGALVFHIQLNICLTH